MKKILVDAFKSVELQDHLTNVIAQDDKCKVDDLGDALIISEARYVLYKYIDGAQGFMQHDEYTEGDAEAKKNVAAIRRFLKKYS
jgi:hypothetical protein